MSSNGSSDEVGKRGRRRSAGDEDVFDVEVGSLPPAASQRSAPRATEPFTVGPITAAYRRDAGHSGCHLVCGVLHCSRLLLHLDEGFGYLVVTQVLFYISSA